jgi:hypothetical protein
MKAPGWIHIWIEPHGKFGGAWFLVGWKMCSQLCSAYRYWNEPNFFRLDRIKPEVVTYQGVRPSLDIPTVRFAYERGKSGRIRATRDRKADLLRKDFNGDIQRLKSLQSQVDGSQCPCLL